MGNRWFAVARSFLSALALAPLAVAADPVRAAPTGEELYLHHCGVCHQPDGAGVPGVIPPLAGNPVVTSEDPEGIQTFLGRIIFGYHGQLAVGDQQYAGRMPPIGYRGRLTDSEVLDLINYVRNAWDNSARSVTFPELDQARAAGRP